MTSDQLLISMLAVFVIAFVFLAAAFYLLNSRPLSQGGARDDQRRRQYTLGAILCAVLGVLFALPPLAFVLIRLLTPAG